MGYVLQTVESQIITEIHAEQFAYDNTGLLKANTIYKCTLKQYNR